jgi:predicted permease
MAVRVALLPRGAIAVIGAGVGLAAMVFALADAYAWKPLPYANPDRLVSIGVDPLPPSPGEWMNVAQDDLPTLASWRARTDLFEDVAAFEDRGWLRVRLSSGRILPLRAVAVTDNLLEVLGLEPRWADPDPAAAWVSHAVITTRSGGELQPGRSAPILPEGVLRVESILPRAFLLPEADRTMPVDALVLRPDGYVMTKDGSSTRTPGLVARTRPGVTPAMLEAALSATMPAGRQVLVVPLSEALTARLRGLALGALLASGLIVLVCWTNVFNIALTRGLFRGPELATRTALGATPGRLVGLLVTEGLRVAALGGASALTVAWLTLSAAIVVFPPQFTALGVPSVTMRVASFIALAGAVAGVSWCVASILAWQVGVRREGRQVTSWDGRTIRVVRFVVVSGQLGAATVLLAGAALLGHSYVNLLRVDAGMDERTQTLTVSHDPNVPPASRRELVERTVRALRLAEGVQAAGASVGGLLDGHSGGGMLWINGQEMPFVSELGRAAMVDWTRVSGDYFDAVGLQFVAGSPPGPGQPAAAVITESVARQYFGGHLPIGEVLLSNGSGVPIVGVVRDVRYRSLSQAPRPTVYEKGADLPGEITRNTYVVRVAKVGQAVAWERIVQRIDPMVVVLDAGAIRERLDRSVRDRTFAALVVGLLAFASVLVTALGLAGIVAYTVVKRTREIAVRLVLGASGSGVTRLVMRETLAAGACGVVGGVIASVWLSRALESLLYDVRPADPATLLLTAVSLLGIVLVAALLPAIRAARIAPAAALRIE